MPRKTKVRVAGDPALAKQVAKVVLDHFETERGAEVFDRAVGRDYSHTDAPGISIYIAVKKPKEASPK
jgi:hypothetical protein